MASSSSLVLSSPSLTPVIKDGEYKNWAELSSELTSSILQRLSLVEILENAQKVCTSWRHVCKDPSMWRKIVMHNLGNLWYDREIMCRHVVDRSQGGLIEIEIWYFCTDSLLNYIADSSSSLRSLTLALCSQITNKGLTEALTKLPLLEELDVSFSTLSRDSLRFVGQSCPNLKIFKLNCVGDIRTANEGEDDALAIAETMPGLHNLQLFGNKLTDAGLNAIIDHCLNLEHLDLRQCFNVNIVGDLEKRCSERVKVLRRPNDSTHDYPYEEVLVFNTMRASEDGFMPNVSYYHDFEGASDNSDYDPYDVYDDPYDMWESLWLLISELDLSSSEFPEYNAFVGFVDRFLEKSCLHELKLKILKRKNNKPCVMRWVDFVARRKLIKHVDVEYIYVSRKRLEVMPVSLYVCETLLYLRLNRVFVGSLDSVSLPYLKTMRLDENMYDSDTGIESLISSCPALEDLSIVRKLDDNDLTHSKTDMLPIALSSVPPQCLLSSLEFVEIKSRYEAEFVLMELANYFAENSVILKKLVVRWKRSKLEEDTVLWDLLSLPWRS
ncbi:hypothetical protein Bca52824_051372 [Brassica carinata]|uniref:F-box domain-containing protein n=1 Tax=Brassica carinata TaxID=52824 RepID=A0A8X7R2A4_BRACI|nr:hypothetical protein Bca52824_051372 [Brassica carinata]